MGYVIAASRARRHGQPGRPSGKLLSWVWVMTKIRAGKAARLSGALSEALESWFPERQIFFRARGEVSFVSISRPLQVCAAALVLIFAGWVSYASLYYMSFDWILRDKNKQIAEARIAYDNVLDQVRSQNERLMSIASNLEQSQTQVLQLFGRDWADATKTDGRKSSDGYTIFDQVIAAGGAFVGQIHRLEDEWQELTNRNVTLESGLTSIEDEVEQILARHTSVIKERDRLNNRVDTLETNLADLRSAQGDFLDHLIKRTAVSIGEAERVIAMTGLSADRMIARVSSRRRRSAGQGGPFIELSADQIATTDPLEKKVIALDGKMARWQSLREVLRRLPLAAPLDHYRMASTFGKRRDPVNRRWSMHYGVDISYHMRTPVLSPAAGRVVFTGWRGGLGWLVEIDHGMGLRTRYGHLRKILVKRGQKLGFRDKIGLLGNSGRSTGPHVHYEVLVDGKPWNPVKFILAGKHVFKG